MSDHPLPPLRRKTMRYPDANYSDAGIYFITICTQDSILLFGKIINGEMVTNSFGGIVWEVWKTLPKRFPQISIDTAIVMPNHFHGIIVIHEDRVNFDDEAARVFPTSREERRKMTLPIVVGYFKMNAAKRINQLRGNEGSRVWQRNYYDRIIKDDKDYDELSEYIFTNPQRWGIEID